MSYSSNPLPFVKYQGAGNDFILVENFNPDSEEVKKLCHRQKGIGADGLLVVSDTSPFTLKIYNCDGSIASMCGNGLRCAGKYLAEKHGLKEFEIRSDHQTHQLYYNQGEIKAQMGAPQFLGSFSLDPQFAPFELIHTGVAHLVSGTDELETLDLEALGPKFAHHSESGDANVNFVKWLGPQEFVLRTFEKGVEAETLACGTGASAAALYGYLKKGSRGPFTAHTRSQDQLKIELSFEGNKLIDLYQSGPAVEVFRGQLKTLREKS